MKKNILIIYILFAIQTYSQNEIHWDGKYQLQLTDFQSTSTQIGNTKVSSLNCTSGFNFLVSMSNIEFLFTKNFNSKVNNRFMRDASSLVSPNKETVDCLINFAQFQFNLSELYARKLRKNLYDNKKTFSDVSFLKPIFDETQKEYSIRLTNATKETDLGSKSSILQKLNAQVLIELEDYAEFCKECKISKKIK